MHWLSYLYPQTVLRTSSRYNRNIRINEEKGALKLLVDGARESGEYIERLWSYAFRVLPVPSEASVRSILVLGVAGGTVIHMLRKRYKNAHITGVDIDQVMIDIGKNYFGLGNLADVTLVCDDAGHFVGEANPRVFDLIILDIFIGPHVPDIVLEANFQKRVKTRLGKKGMLVVNYLRQPGYEKKADTLYDMLQRLYPKVTVADRHNNRFFLARQNPDLC